jgi:hypothetical protein
MAPVEGLAALVEKADRDWLVEQSERNPLESLR